MMKKCPCKQHLWLVKLTPQMYPPSENKGLIAGLDKGNPMVFISPDHKGPRLFLGDTYVFNRGGFGWLAIKHCSKGTGSCSTSSLKLHLMVKTTKSKLKQNVVNFVGLKIMEEMEDESYGSTIKIKPYINLVHVQNTVGWNLLEARRKTSISKKNNGIKSSIASQVFGTPASYIRWWGAAEMEEANPMPSPCFIFLMCSNKHLHVHKIRRIINKYIYIYV